MTALRERLKQLNPGDHVCFLHATARQWRDFVSVFVSTGLSAGQRVVVLSGEPSLRSPRSPYDTMRLLRDEGLDPVRRIYEGQLVLRCGERACGGLFEVERALAFFREEIGQAKADGFSGLRVTLDLSFIARVLGGGEAILRYEAALSDFFSTQDVIVACQYDRNVFSDEFLVSVLDFHPVIVDGERVLENGIFYSPFHESLGPAAASYKLEGRLKALDEWTHQEGRFNHEHVWLQRLAANAPVGVFVANALGSCTYVNRQWCAMFGRTLEQALGMAWVDVIDREDSELLISRWMKKVSGGGDFEGTFRVHSGGVAKTQWVSARARALRGRRGEIKGHFVVFQDVTAGYAVEGELREANRHLSAVFRELPAIVSITEFESGRFLDVNDEFERFSGFSRDALVGRTPAEVGLLAGVEARVEDDVGGSWLSGLSRMRVRTGEVVDVSISASVIGHKSGPCVLSVLTPCSGAGLELVTPVMHALDGTAAG